MIFMTVSSAGKRLRGSLAKFAMLKPRGRLLVNVMPKSGTVLLRNVLTHFFGERYVRAPTLTHDKIIGFARHSDIYPEDGPSIVLSHLPLYPQASYFYRSMTPANMAILLREPVENSYSLTRHLMRRDQDEESGVASIIKERNIPFQEVLFYTILGRRFSDNLAIEGITVRWSPSVGQETGRAKRESHRLQLPLPVRRGQ
jgi:hypothetical protein